MQTVFELCQTYNITPRTIVEFGACHPYHIRVQPFIERGDRVILVEANPRLAYCLQNGFDDGDFRDTWPHIPNAPHTYRGLSSYQNVQILNVAITEEPSTVALFEFNASSYVQGVVSPAIINNGFIENEHRSYTVEGVTIQSIDDGTIDVLLADVEGSEWFCLKGLISRPKMIILELYGGNYLNPHYEDIRNWMIENDYVFMDRDHSDALFVKK